MSKTYTFPRGKAATMSEEDYLAGVAKKVPTTKPKKNGKAQDEANSRAQAIIESIVEKIIASRGTDDVGADDQWEDERLDSCNDYVYDLAVEVRKLRDRGEAWWRIAQLLSLPGAGASAAQGKTGAAYARRLWERAWGKTYGGDKAPRDTRQRRQERALTDAHRAYFNPEVPDQTVVNEIRGRLLHWVARLGTDEHGIITSAQEAYVHDDERLIKVKIHPGTGKRYIEFYEQIDANQLKVDPKMSLAKSGPIRSVYLDRITRVGA